MSNYYYLIAQLPGFTSAVPFSYAYFIDLCSRFLSKKDMQILRNITLEPPKLPSKTGSVILDRWFDWERILRTALSGIRAVRMKKEMSGSLMSVPPDILQTARTAVNFDNPLEAELYLNTERQKALQIFLGMNGFSANAVFMYALRLKLTERRALFNEESGMASYRTIYNQILGESK